MYGFFMFGSTLTLADLACKTSVDLQKTEKFPKDLEGTGGKIKLYKNHNEGFSFGFLKGSLAVKLVPLCLTSAIGGAWAYLMGARGRWAEKLALTLIFSGGMSNLLDRLVRGYVVDYICIQLGVLKKVVFNIADVCILAGGAILVLSQGVETIKDMIKK